MGSEEENRFSQLVYYHHPIFEGNKIDRLWQRLKQQVILAL